MEPNELFDNLDILDRETFTDELMNIVAEMKTFTKETQAGAILIPHLDIVSLGEYLMLHEIVKWSAVKLLETLNDLTTLIHNAIEVKEANNAN